MSYFCIHRLTYPLPSRLLQPIRSFWTVLQFTASEIFYRGEQEAPRLATWMRDNNGRSHHILAHFIKCQFHPCQVCQSTMYVNYSKTLDRTPACLNTSRHFDKLYILDLMKLAVYVLCFLYICQYSKYICAFGSSTKPLIYGSFLSYRQSRGQSRALYHNHIHTSTAM